MTLWAGTVDSGARTKQILQCTTLRRGRWNQTVILRSIHCAKQLPIYSSPTPAMIQNPLIPPGALSLNMLCAVKELHILQQSWCFYVYFFPLSIVKTIRLFECFSVLFLMRCSPPGLEISPDCSALLSQLVAFFVAFLYGEPCSRSSDANLNFKSLPLVNNFTSCKTSFGDLFKRQEKQRKDLDIKA